MICCRQQGGFFMQCVINAYDGKDEGAFERRMSVRPQHLENIAGLNEAGHVVCAGGMTNSDVICAGGMTNSEGKLIGSVLIMDFESRDQLDDYLANEPYVKANVWEDIKVEPINVVIANAKK